MTDKTLRSRVALTELEAMGLTIDDLLAVAGWEELQRPSSGGRRCFLWPSSPQGPQVPMNLP